MDEKVRAKIKVEVRLPGNENAQQCTLNCQYDKIVFEVKSNDGVYIKKELYPNYFRKLEKSGPHHLVLAYSDGLTLKFTGEYSIDLLFETYPSEAKFWGAKALYQTSSFKIVGYSLAAISIIALVAWFVLIPWAIGALVNVVPLSLEEKIGGIIRQEMTEGANIDTQKSLELEKFCKSLAYPSDYNLKLIVINDPKTINAFALPGGTIVVYSGMLNLLTNENELAGLIAHELTHINKKHSLRAIFNSKGIALLIASITGNFDSKAILIASKLHELAYSRDLETEADMIGMNLMYEQNFNPYGMVTLMEKLKAANDQEGGGPAFLQTHPSTDSRIAYLKEASEAFADKSFKRPEVVKLQFYTLKGWKLPFDSIPQAQGSF